MKITGIKFINIHSLQVVQSSKQYNIALQNHQTHFDNHQDHVHQHQHILQIIHLHLNITIDEEHLLEPDLNSLTLLIVTLLTDY